MGIVAKAGKPAETEDVEDLVVAYRAMVDAMRKSGEPGFDRVRYSRLELKCDALWQKLDRSQQMIAVDRLVASGHINPDLAKALTLFNGTLATDDKAKEARIKK